MKLLVGLLVSLAISSTFALPAGTPDDDVEYVPTSRRKYLLRQSDDEELDARDYQGVRSSGPVQVYGKYPFFSSLPSSYSLNFGFFNEFQDIFRQLYTRLVELDNSQSDSDSKYETDVGSSEDKKIIPFALTPKNGNTTSFIKVVDGHKLEINDTVFGDNNGRSIFKVRVINIRPVEDDEKTDVETSSDIDTTTSDDKGSPEVLEKSNKNDIDGDIDELESTSTTELHDISTEQPTDNFTTDAAVEINSDATVSSESSDSTESTLGHFIDVSDHIKRKTQFKNEELTIDFGEPQSEETDGMADIKSITENSMTMESDDKVVFRNHNQPTKTPMSSSLLSLDIDNDAIFTTTSSLTDYLKNEKKNHTELLKEELLFSEENEDDGNENVDDNYENQKFKSYEWLESMEGVADENNNMDNDIDVYGSISVDLSNDIAINDLLADQGAPFEPDAEIFNVDEFKLAKNSRIDFNGFEGNRTGGEYQTSVNTQFSNNQPIKK